MTGANNRVALIVNAGDIWGDRGHADKAAEQTRMFKALGMEAEDLDLRAYVGRERDLDQHLRAYGSVWVAGGNTFVLRRAMRDSGFDQIITGMLEEDAIVYGGYSAGICVLAPTLRGLDLVDDPAEVGLAYQKEVIWDGLGVLPYTPIPHFQSEYLEAEMIDKVISYLTSHGMAHKTLRDDEAIVIDGQTETLLKAT